MVAIAQPMIILPVQRLESITPQTAGTIRYANVSSTPAMRTKLVTTRPNTA